LCFDFFLVVKGEGFTAKELTIQNTVGPANHQAIAVFIQAENVAFYRCKFRGYQDTIYYNSGKQFYRECIIEGTIDFIFGYGNAVFQKCQTADGRKTKRTNTGLNIQSCTMGATANIS
jgi:pectinesterase